MLTTYLVVGVLAMLLTLPKTAVVMNQSGLFAALFYSLSVGVLWPASLVLFLVFMAVATVGEARST